MYHKHQTRGIVFAGMNEGDDSRRVLIFTDKFGLIGAKAGGSRKLISKMRYGIQNFSFSDFSLVRGRAGWRVVGSTPHQNFFEDLKHTKEKLNIISNVINLLRKLLPGEEENTKLFDIVSNFFIFLITAEKSAIKVAECLVLLRILHNLGFMREDPELTLCFVGTALDEDNLSLIAPRRERIVKLINDSLKASVEA